MLSRSILSKCSVNEVTGGLNCRPDIQSQLQLNSILRNAGMGVRNFGTNSPVNTTPEISRTTFSSKPTCSRSSSENETNCRILWTEKPRRQASVVDTFGFKTRSDFGLLCGRTFMEFLTYSRGPSTRSIDEYFELVACFFGKGLEPRPREPVWNVPHYQKVRQVLVDYCLDA